MFGKRNLDFGIIIGENGHHLLSLDEYAEHFLLPYSPRFRNIDFAVSSLSTMNIKNIAVFTKRDKEFILDYLVKGWPLIKFYVFDFIDIKDKFVEFLNQYTLEHQLDMLAIMKGNYPVWFDMRVLKETMEKKGAVATVAEYGKKTVYSCLVVDRKSFLKKYESMLLDEKSLEIDLIQTIVKEDNIPTIETKGYITPFTDLKDYYEIHINMLEDYLVFDRFNAYVPIRGDLALNISSNLARHSHVINSIVGENVEISGKVENSVIFSNVKVDRNAYIKNSIILPGNHIGSDAVIINSIIDEYSGDNTTPNIEHKVQIGGDKPAMPNNEYPDILNFGVTLIGKDVRIPAGCKIGSNCYLDSFLTPSQVREHKILKDGLSILRSKAE